MKLKCLVVDDDPTFQALMKNYIQKKFKDRLELLGIAKNGTEAKELYEQYQKKLDIVFLDVKMPDMSGFDVLDQINREDDIQIVMVTGQQERAIDAFDYGLTDYLVKPFSSERFEKTLSRIERSKAQKTESTSPENTVIKKLAQFMYSRDIDALEPIPSRFGKQGYVYPMLTANFEFEREAEIHDLMDAAIKSSFFTSSFHDSAHVCNSCYNSYLHYRETCPNCGSSNIRSEDLVHHFQCANVSPQSEYYVGGDTTDMSCPKCDRKLNHIGVDYDKPGVIYDCKNCDHSFQNAQISALCLNCGAEQKVEHLLRRELRSYYLTSLGRDAAKDKVTIALSGYDKLGGIIDEPYFLRILKREAERKKEAEFDSCIGALHLGNIAEIETEIGRTDLEDLIQEIHELISSEIKPADEVIFRNLQTVLLLFPEKNLESSEAMLEKVSESLKTYIQDNLDDIELKIQATADIVSEDSSSRDQVDRLLARFEDREESNDGEDSEESEDSEAIQEP